MSGVIIGLGALGAVLYALTEQSDQSERPSAAPAPPGPTRPAIVPAGQPPGDLPPGDLPPLSPPHKAPSPPVVPEPAAGGWPGSPQRQRERVVELLRTMDAPYWATLTFGEAGERVRIGVMAAPLTVKGAFTMVRPMESQWLADALGGMPLTPFVAWQMVRHAVVPVTPPQWHDALTVQELQAHTEAQIQAKLHRDRKAGELIAGGWKWWALSRRLWEHSQADPRSANFGLFAKGAAFGPIQGVGTVHRLAHTDWSQLHQHMSALCEIETPSGWIQQATADVLVHPQLAPRLCGTAHHIYAPKAMPKWGAVVGEGALPGARHPFIPFWVSNVA